jgi:hypothetical protein
MAVGALAFSCGGDGSSGDGKTATPSADGGPGGAPGADGATKPPPPIGPGSASSLEGNVVTYQATSLGLDAFSANGRIQPHGQPTEYWFEYGPTTNYGSKTPVRQLSPKLAAHYREKWDRGLGGWRGGDGLELAYHASGGVQDGYVRYGEPTGDDFNHVDGIGILHLAQYFYIGFFDADAPTVSLGGSDPDLRDAKVRVCVRGVSWKPNGSELMWWSQVDVTHGKPPPNGNPAFSNWAYTGFNLTDYLVSGNWEQVEYRLVNDTNQWTYAGTNRALDAQGGRGYYVYTPLDDVLGHLDTDIFHVLTYIENTKYPTGSIDFDEIEITYRNHSLLYGPNGGKVVSTPAGSDDASKLTDGWRFGADKTWKTGQNPYGPQEIVYDLENPVVVDKVQLHQNPDWPSRNVQVLSSVDGTTWETIFDDAFPTPGTKAPNFDYLLVKDLSAPAKKIKIRITSGYKDQYWGLGEVEIFGSGAKKKTDDDWYNVNADITGLKAGQTYHYRVVAKQGDVVELGGDLTFTVPQAAKVEVATGPASRIANGVAKVEGRLNTLGTEAQVWFEYGPDTNYGKTTPQKRAGQEITPRTFVGALTELTPGSIVHYRLVAESALGRSVGADQAFVAK